MEGKAGEEGRGGACHGETWQVVVIFLYAVLTSLCSPAAQLLKMACPDEEHARRRYSEVLVPGVAKNWPPLPLQIIRAVRDAKQGTPLQRWGRWFFISEAPNLHHGRHCAHSPKSPHSQAHDFEYFHTGREARCGANLGPSGANQPGATTLRL